MVVLPHLFHDMLFLFLTTIGRLLPLKARRELTKQEETDWKNHPFTALQLKT